MRSLNKQQRLCWNRLLVKVHDSMVCAFQNAEGDLWQDDSEGGGPPMKLIDALEELDDIQQVYSNLDISDELMAKYEAQAA